MSARSTTSSITRREFVHRGTMAAVTLPLAGIAGIMTANAVSAVLPTLSPSRAEALTTTSTTVVTTTTTTTVTNTGETTTSTVTTTNGDGIIGQTYTVHVAKGYLALRTAMAYDAANEIGTLYTGDTVQILYVSNPVYWYVYAPRLQRTGYVNANYLVGGNGSADAPMIVSVAKGYLALRTAKTYDATNEIGELYTGDIVDVQDASDPAYWYVYSPKLGRSGYVNKNYLVDPTGTFANTYTVSVATGYLALRCEMAYDECNELGALYTGDIVQVLQYETGSDNYWLVYAPRLGIHGYVNCNYLIAAL